MDATNSSNHRTGLAVFVAALLVALTWAAVTNHVWEDYYITYRSSRNLAVGNGLVFNPGDRLHTFTSPLGVLLPAAACFVTGTKSDAGAIWVFRVWSAAAFAGAAMLVFGVARRQRYGAAALLLAALVVLDAKSIDFTTNGMETGFLLLFIAYMWWAMFTAGPRPWLHLGLAWGALMWTRPDSFLYIGLLAAGAFLFNDPARTGRTRGEWIKFFLQAGVVCTAIYLPWLLWAWWYYGTPVPHTITAKGGVSGEVKTAWGALKTLLGFPVTVWTGRTSLESTFLPSYFQIGGWPELAVNVARGLAVLLAFQWVVWWWRVEVRVASFAYCGMHVYLTYFPFFPFPWYLPGTALLAALTFGGMIAQLWEWTQRAPRDLEDAEMSRGVRWTLIAVVVGALGGEAWLTWQMAREMKVEQVYSATGTRRKVGEWLRAHAGRSDTVFMEPLGHIGYFSRLKTYDFPGLSSREVVEAIRRVGPDWPYLIDYLSPNWVVLRPTEFERIKGTLPWLFGDDKTYRLVQEFNSLEQIRGQDVYGRNYVEFDAHLLLFQRQFPKRERLIAGEGVSFPKLGLPPIEIGGQVLYRAEDSPVIRVKVPPGAKHVWIMYGASEEAYRGVETTDGVAFMVHYSDGRRTRPLFSRTLNPRARAEDRKLQIFDAKLPRHDDGAELILITTANQAQKNRGCWSEPDFSY